MQFLIEIILKIKFMKILIYNWQDIKNPYGGGAEVHLHEIFKRISAMGHDVTLCCCRFEDSLPEEIIDGISVQRTGSRSLFNFRVPSTYYSKYSNDKFDLIIDDINKIPFYTPLFIKKFPLLAISHHFFGKSIFRESGLIAGSYVYGSEKLVDCVYKKTPFVVVSQSTLDEFISRGFNPDNFSIIQNAIEQEKFPMKVGLKYDFPVVTYFGRLKKYKSVDHLFKAFALVSTEIPNAQLHILGRGDFRTELENLAITLNISDKVKFFGYITEGEKLRYLSFSNCVVNTSMKEGWGITNIEANACGTPVISANVPGLRDSVQEGVSGLLYEYGNIGQLAKMITELLLNDDLKQKLNVGAVNWAKTFSWDNSAKLMLHRCEEVVEKHKEKKYYLV